MEAGFHEIMSVTGVVLDGTGVLIAAIGSLVSLVRFLVYGLRNVSVSYRTLREDVGRAILLGLEFLIAGDIIRSVVVDPTLMNVLTLGVIVIIRTFLSMTLELEIEGRWPWQHADKHAMAASPPAARA